jgi:signal peptidase I
MTESTEDADASSGRDDGASDEGLDDELDASDENSFVKGLIEWVVVLVGAVVVALVLRAFLFQAFWIPSESMESTLMTQDRVLVNKISYRLHDINRGDIVVFERPDDQVGEIRDLIKRVIGIPGDTIEGRDNVVYVNGSRLIERYLEPDIVTSDFGPIDVPEDEIFVMGDNRGQSFDSRFFGTVDQDRVRGRAFVLFWPFDRIGSL